VAKNLDNIEDVKEEVNTTINFNQQPTSTTYNGVLFSS